MFRLTVSLLLITSCPLIANAQPFTVSKDPGRLNAEATFGPCEAAGDLEYLKLCNRFTTESGRASCLGAANRRHFDQCALDLCNRFTTENGAIDCLRAAADKHYLTEEMEVCNRSTTENGATMCLRASGEFVETIDREEIARRVERALRRLNQNRIEQARSELEDLLDALER